MKRTLVSTSVASILFLMSSAAFSPVVLANGLEKVDSEQKEQTRVVVERNASGVRELDMTNSTHVDLVKSRLSNAGKDESSFPQLHRSLNELKTQQEKKKSDLEYGLLNEPVVDPIDVDLIENAHLFLDLNVAISEDNNEPYLIINAKSSVFGGTVATYIDLLLEDLPSGTPGARQVAPMGSVLTVLDGKDTLVSSIVNLQTLKENFPDLETIYASSYVETEDENGNIVTALKYTEYPFSWERVDAQYNAIVNGPDYNPDNVEQFLNKKIKYDATAPIDLNHDGVIKVCLNRAHSDCDYAADQYRKPNEITDVNIPFTGSVQVPFKLFRIYDSDQQVVGIDEVTNIYLQEGVYGGATKQSYKSLAADNPKLFSDYLTFSYDDTKKVTTIEWDIPREEGRFGNAKLFSNIAQANWYITFAVNGVPSSTGRGRAANFQVTVSSEELGRFGNHFNDVLQKMKLGYSCLAKGTLITLADGSEIAIENIQKGDFVLGAIADKPGSAEEMQVVDVSVGVEAIEMYRVYSGDESILMTETHPVSTSNRGIIWAKELNPGDRILTEDGSMVITEIATEAYSDNVYNLKLAPKAGTSLQTTSATNFGMFANGMLVGDLATQDIFNYKDQNIPKTKEEILQQLPEKWKKDYLNSL